MATLREALVSVLAADTGNLLVDLAGGVYGQALDARQTPAAFERRTGEAARLRPAAVVALGGVGISLGGVTLGASRSVTVWLYEPWPGRSVIERARARVVELLHRRAVMTGDEGQVVLAFIGDLGDGPPDEDLNASIEQVRFRAATMLGREAGA